MSRDKLKIIEDTIKYLRYHKDYNSYDIFKNEIKKSGVFLFDGDDISEKSEDYVKVKSDSETKMDIKKGIPAESAANLVREPGANVSIYKDEKVQKHKMSVNNDNWKKIKTLDAFAEEIKNCSKCSILSSGRKQIVFGTGNPDSDVVVVGEAPGADEDEQGKPFVGRAGKLLTDILKAINFTREEIFICNILKCRPPDNRNPLPDEIENCEPYLFKQLEMIKPKLILAVGTFAAQTLLKSKEPLGKLRGKFHLYNGIKMMVTYHPAALLRNPNWKRPTWEDVQLFRKEYDSLVNS